MCSTVYMRFGVQQAKHTTLTAVWGARERKNTLFDSKSGGCIHYASAFIVRVYTVYLAVVKLMEV